MAWIIAFGCVLFMYYLIWTWMSYISCRDQAEFEVYNKQTEPERKQYIADIKMRAAEREDREYRERGRRSCENPVGRIVEDWFW